MTHFIEHSLDNKGIRLLPTPKPSNFQTLNSPTFKLSNFQLPNFQTFNFQLSNFQLSNFQTFNFQLSNFQTFNSPTFKLSNFQLSNFQLLTQTHPRIKHPINNIYQNINNHKSQRNHQHTAHPSLCSG